MGTAGDLRLTALPFVGAPQHWHVWLWLPRRWPCCTDLVGLASCKIATAEGARRIPRTCTCLTSLLTDIHKSSETPRTYGDHVLPSHSALLQFTLILILVLIPNMNACTGTVTWAQTKHDTLHLHLPAKQQVPIAFEILFLRLIQNVPFLKYRR